MEQHPVVGNEFFGLVKLTGGTLGVATAQVARRQHSLHASMPKHGLGGQAHLAEEPLRAATGEIKHGLGLGAGGLRVADDGHVVSVFDVQQGTGSLFRQATGQLFVDKVDHLGFQRRRAQ